MMNDKNLTPNEFRQEIAELADNYRIKIELEVEDFEVDESQKAKRIKKVNDDKS